MNEIEKMYKLANLKAINIAEYGSTYIPQVVEIDGKLYPPFTAEKQIEITKFLISKYARFKKFRSYEQKDLSKVFLGKSFCLCSLVCLTTEAVRLQSG